MHANAAAASIIAAGPIPVLDKGHVALLNCDGTDALVAFAARSCYGNEAKPTTPEKDRGLIRRMMRDSHTSSFEIPGTTWHIKVPKYAWFQAERHRTASLNERSGRYSELKCEFQRTEPNAWRLQDQNNKQGSDGFLPEYVESGSDTPGGWNLTYEESRLFRLSAKVYADRLDGGNSREQARKDLPMSFYTEMVWKIDLHNLLHFLRLRLAPDAQLEIRLYAQAIASVVERLFPVTWEAFVDYRLESMTLSRMEVLSLYSRFTGNAIISTCMSDHETADYIRKLARLGLVAEKGGERG